MFNQSLFLPQWKWLARWMLTFNVTGCSATFCFHMLLTLDTYHIRVFISGSFPRPHKITHFQSSMKTLLSACVSRFGGAGLALEVDWTSDSSVSDSSCEPSWTVPVPTSVADAEQSPSAQSQHGSGAAIYRACTKNMRRHIWPPGPWLSWESRERLRWGAAAGRLPAVPGIPGLESSIALAPKFTGWRRGFVADAVLGAIAPNRHPWL